METVIMLVGLSVIIPIVFHLIVLSAAGLATVVMLIVDRFSND